jgi:hypothetical protein
MTNETIVTWAGIGAGSVCFILYVIQSVLAMLPKPAQAAKNMVGAKVSLLVADPAGVSIDELTKLLQAAATLTDSLAKAGPALTSLIGAILFFAVAAIGSGALHGAPPDKGASAQSSQPPAASASPNTP